MSQSDSGGGSRLARLLPRAVRKRFVAKFFLSVLVVMLVTGALGAVFYQSATATLTERTESKMASTAELQANGLDRWVDGLSHQTRLLSQAPAFQRDDHSDIDYYLLRKQQTLRSDVLDIHYVDTNTREVLVSTNDDVEETNLSKAGVPWASEEARAVAMETNLASRTYVASQPYESPSSGERVLAFISAPPKNTEHAVVVEANLSACHQSFDQPSEAAYTTVHGDGGRPVCATADAENVDAPSGALSGNASGVTTGGGEVAGYATVAGTGWTVVSHTPKSAAFSLRQQIGTSILALVLIPLVVLGVVSAVVGRRTGRELGRLTDRAEQMREGDLDVDLTTDRVDEFGQLYRGFAEMRDALKQQIEEARQARREAEVSRAEALETNRYLEEKAADYSEIMAAGARGDLTRRMEADGQNEAMDRIAEDFNEMIRELELTTGQLGTFAEEVSEGGEDVHARAETVRSASERVAESMQQISDDARGQVTRLEDVARELDDAAAALEDLQNDHPNLAFDDALDRIRAVAELVEAAAATGETVVAESETVTAAAQEQAAELTEVSARALELKRTAQYLGDGISHFETEAEHEFVFQTGDGGVGAGVDPGDD